MGYINYPKIISQTKLKTEEKPYLILLFGGANLFSTGKVSDTIETLKTELTEYINDNDFDVIVESFNTELNPNAIINSIKFISNNYQNHKIIIYGYSLGGYMAVQVCKLIKTKNIIIETLFTIDAATGIAGDINSVNDILKIPDNVLVNINYYQTEKNVLDSRGYPHKKEKGNTKTSIININYDRYKSKKKFGAHGSMDEDTKDKVLNKIIHDLDKYYLKF